MLLINAIRGGRLEQVKMFIKVGMDVNQFDENGQTGLIHSCFLQKSRIRLKIIKALIFAGADVNRKDIFGRNVLSWACLKGRFEVIKFLLNDPLCFDLQVDVIDCDGNNTLLLSVVSGNFNVVKTVVGVLKGTARESQLNKPNNSGMQPLTAAFLRGDKLCAQLLMKEIGASLVSVFKYLRDFQNGSIELHRSKSAFALFESTQDKEKIRKNLVQFAQFTDTELFEFLFAEAQSRQCDLGTTRSDQISREKSHALKDEKGLPRRFELNKEKPFFNNSSERIAYTCEIDARGHLGKCSSKPFARVANVSGDYPIKQKESCRTSVQQLMLIYAEQNSPSFRRGVPARKCTEKWPQDFNTEADDEFDFSRLPSGVQPNQVESLTDLQLRLKYGRNVRATSMQVPTLPSLSGVGRGKIKRTRSSSVMKVKS
ncbi:uncharacterized protein [Montipora capricornis]|uniref:uncharacterized protein n=1 Tax=Montipora capricornis TaxID=246305 RepID=UPI0035F19F8E